MKQVAPLSFPTALFFLAALLFAYSGLFPVGAGVFAWLGGIQVFNSIAPRTPFSRLIHWIHAMTFELLAFLGVFAFRFIPARSKTKESGRPILLIHGYMNYSSVWLLFKKRLEVLGLGPIYTINLGYPFRSIRIYAEKIRKKAEEIAQETGRNDLILIGHSMGGLVSSLYAAALAPQNTVTDVITMGAPIHGTPVAYIGIGPNAKEMRPSSKILQEIREGMKKRQEIRFYHVATKSDQLVIPGASALIPENEHFIFEDLGHASLLYSKRASDLVAKWLLKEAALKTLRRVKSPF